MSFVSMISIFLLACVHVPSKPDLTLKGDFEFLVAPSEAPPVRVKYGKGKHIGRYSHIFLDREIDEDSVKGVIKRMDEAEVRGDEAVIIEINSPGGSVPDGFVLAKRIEDNALPVVCEVDNEASSMANYIFQSCKYRAMSKRSNLMLHEPSVGGLFQGQPSNWRSMADMLHAMSVAMAEQLASRSTVTAEEILRRIDGGKMWWIGWKEAKELKMVDFIGTVPEVIDHNWN